MERTTLLKLNSKYFIGLLASLVVAGFMFSCGDPEFRTDASPQSLTAADWDLDENGHFLTCPVIVGCDEDGDCIMNVDDSSIDTSDEWRAVCTNKYSEENALDLCMRDYTNEYNECVGEDFEGIIATASAPTAGEYFKDNPAVIQRLATGLARDFGSLLKLEDAKYSIDANSKKIISGIVATLKSWLSKFLSIDWMPWNWNIRNFYGRVLDLVGLGEADAAENSGNYKKALHGIDAFYGAYKIDFVKQVNGDETCRSSGIIYFTPKEADSSAQCIIDLESKNCNINTSKGETSLTTAQYDFPEDGQMMITPVQFEGAEEGTPQFTLKNALPTAATITKVGCYPIGGRDAERNDGVKIKKGFPKLYNNLEEMKVKEIEQCYEFYKEELDYVTIEECKQKIKCEFQLPPSLYGVVQGFALAGKLNNGGEEVLVGVTTTEKHKLFMYTRGGELIAQTHQPLCFTGYEYYYDKVFVTAKYADGTPITPNPAFFKSMVDSKIPSADELYGKDQCSPLECFENSGAGECGCELYEMLIRQ